MTPQGFVEALKKNAFTRFTGVPCSFFQAAINHVLDEPDLEYTIMPNEGAALALASGAYLAGKPTVLLIQNSGFGNLLNPLTSLNMIYGIPALIFMSGRAYGVQDEPQHEVIGRTMGPLLKALGVGFEEMPEDQAAFEKSLSRVRSFLDTEKKPYFYFVKQGTIDEGVPARTRSQVFPMKRIDAIRVIAGELTGAESVIATTGKPSRELFSLADRKENFYMQGSMGHASSVGLGVALARPRKKVVVLDGDGALLMHLGALSSIGYYRPSNLYHVVLDNESYETTGDQETTSSTTDFEAMALAAGYRAAFGVQDAEALRATFKKMLSQEGPVLLRVKINRLPTPGIPRISSKYDSRQIADIFRAGMLSVLCFFLCSLSSSASAAFHRP